MEVILIMVLTWFGLAHDEAGTLPHYLIYGGSECVEEGHRHPIENDKEIGGIAP